MVSKEKLTRAEAITVANAIISNSSLLEIVQISFEQYGEIGKIEALAQNVADIYPDLIEKLMEVKV